MANELADELRAKDFQVLLTRTDDSFVPLDERTALANKHKADLFISLHCNASTSQSLNGFEVYFLSEKATNARAEAVARQENASLELEGKKPSSAVQSVLASLVINANINRAAQLGAMINREVTAQVSQADLGVKQAQFYVLRGAHMPAVLVELGFLTNKKEERLLSSESYRRKLARAIAKSIIDFDQKQQAERKPRHPGR
jgi:N-acetylmuramoyl-L-alanine amidase